MSVAQELVRHVMDTSFQGFDASVLDKARDRIMDVVGCVIAGANAPGCGMLRDLVRDWGGKGEATILAQGDRVPAHNAALVNSVMARSYDFEPAGPIVGGKSTPAHISGTTIPTAIAIAEARGATGRELLTALILGDDLASRLIAASNLDLDSGFDCTGTANAFGAAAIAARLWGLDEQQMMNAFGIVLNQLAGTFQNIFDGVHSFKLPQGLSAQAGILSAALARRGFTGVKDPFFGKYGYFALYCRTSEPEVLTRDLGREFCADVTCKPYPCCRSNHAAIDCILGLVACNPIHPEDIDEVVVDVPAKALEFAVGQHFKIREVPQIDAAFSLQYNVANALLRKSVKLEHYTEEFVRDPGIMGIVPKVRLTANMPADKPLAAHVKIRTKQGKEYDKRVDMPKGNGIFSPLTAAEKREKFFRSVAFSGTVPLERAERALSLIEILEEVEDVGRVIKLLVA
jgi:2-methylcitrate dehydratase PrpD